jgi:hypothetical protein
MFAIATNYGELRRVQCRNKLTTPDIFRILPEVKVGLLARNSAITSVSIPRAGRGISLPGSLMMVSADY